MEYQLAILLAQTNDAMYRKLTFCNLGINGHRVRRNDELAASKINWWRFLNNVIEEEFSQK